MAKNKPLTTVNDDNGYYYYNGQRKNLGDHNIVLSFSGGGTRAAALSYGVLQELRDTQVDAGGQRVRILDEVDNISSVSGGSFTAAYYGLFGDDIFTEYEDVFLRRGVQGTLLRKMFNPVYWWKSLFSAFNRTEMAVEYYDTSIFRGKTFADMPRSERAFVEINATDLSGGNRFSFTQGMFDLVCSDLDHFSVARAVTASSAVPIAFPSVVLENHAGDCAVDAVGGWDHLFNGNNSDPRMQDMRTRYTSYLDAKKRPYIHLVDGGLTDNLGVRAIFERIDLMGGIAATAKKSTKPAKDVLIILVNAEVKPQRSIDQSPEKPTVSDTVNAISDIQISLFNVETRALIKQRLQEYEDTLQGNGYDIHFYFAEVSFESISSRSERQFFNNLPTTLQLSDEEIDKLITAGRTLLRDDPGYQAFLKANGG